MWNFNRYNLENWSIQSDLFPTKEDAIEAGKVFFREEYPDEKCFDVGEVYTPVYQIYGDEVIERLAELAYEEACDFAEGWLDGVTKAEELELQARLNVVLQKWLEETHNEPTFHLVRNIETVSLEEGEKI